MSVLVIDEDIAVGVGVKVIPISHIDVTQIINVTIFYQVE